MATSSNSVNACQKVEENDEKEGSKKVVASDDNRVNEKQDKKEKEIDLGISLDKLSIGPKKKLLVLPIGDIFVHRAHRGDPNPIKRHPDFLSGNFMVYKRPYIEGFLKFCFERFEVGIWSSARERNIDGVLTNIMGELRSKLLFTWDHEQCTNSGFTCLNNKYKPLYFKELKYIWTKKWRDGEYSSSNTLLITDPPKAILNPPNTTISPGDYDPENREDNFLGPKGELRAFLDGLAEAKDVPTYVKDHPFGEPAITPSHADWDYYEDIVRALGRKIEAHDHN